MSFLYPRTISVYRQAGAAAGSWGARGFGGAQPAKETLVRSGMPASIQASGPGRQTDANLPNDADGRGAYKVFIPRQAAALGLFEQGDIVVDDQGCRYQVRWPYWNSLGYQLAVERLRV